VAGVPVLTAVRTPYDEVWRGFHGGLGQELAPELGGVVAWAMCAVARTSDIRTAQPPIAV
jgi:hypothetical protein